MRIINKKYLLIILLVGIILTGVIIFKPKENIQLDNVILKQEVNNKTMAMYVGRDNNYEKYEGNSFPKGYRLNQDKSKCIDNNGAEINNALKEENGSISLTTNKSSYCYLYFDEKENISNICNGSNMHDCMSNEDKLNKIKTVESLSNDIVGDMYRYQGTDNVSNWICFGTENNCSTNENDIDKYMYRIIGITSAGELKLIKETFINENDVKTFQWNDKYSATDCGNDGEKCTWPDSMIFKRLNGISNGNVEGTDGNSDIFIGNSYYDYLNDNGTWLDMIEDRLWKYGNIHNDSFNGNEVYNLEKNFTTDNTTLGTEPKGKIGLMYLHDYLYAYKTNESDAGNPEIYSNAKNAWIFFKNDGFNSLPDYEWLIVPRPPKGEGSVRYVPSNGITPSGAVSDNNIFNKYLGVRPTFYLKSSIKLSGLGTIDSPYLIN